MAEYIEREALALSVLELEIVDPVVAQYADAVLWHIQQAPAADVASVRHGKWIVTKEFNDVLDMDVEKYTCSACGEYRLTASGLSHATNYCPNCGAKMDADE